jgi:hypothetical protein
VSEEQRYVTALRMNSLMRELAYTLVHLRHEHKKLTGDLLLHFSTPRTRPHADLPPFTLPEVPPLLREYKRRSSRVRLQPMFSNISDTHGSRFFFNKQMVVCDECYERCMLSDSISAVPCIASATHYVANEVAIMRSIEDQFEVKDTGLSASALPSVLLNIFDGAVDSIWDLDYQKEAQKASEKLKFAKEALQNMMALLSMRRPHFRDRVHEGVFNGLVHIEQEQVALRAELIHNLSLNFITRLRSSTTMTWLRPTDRQSLIAKLTLDNDDRLSLGRYAIDHIRDSVHVLERVQRQRYFTHPENLFKECPWLRAAFPSDPAHWTEISCARALQHVETQYEEIGGILEFCRMAAEVLNREGELLKLRKQLLVEHDDVQRRAMEVRDRVQSLSAEEASASASILVERCRLAESKCSRLLVRQKLRTFLGRLAQGDCTDLTCDSCSIDLQRDWVLLRCCHKFCAACWNSPVAASQTASRCCAMCHVQLLRHDVFESSHHKFGSELGTYDLAHWTSHHPLNRSRFELPGLGHKQLFRLTADFDTVAPHQAQLSSSSILAPIQSGSDLGTRLNVCIRRIRCINEQSNGSDKVVVASFSFGSGPASTLLKDALVNALKREGISAVCVSGAQAQQAEAIRKFDDHPDICVLLLDMHSSYSGVTLTAANHLLLLDPFHNLPEAQQIIARISRQGQRKPCFIYHMCCDASVEEAILVKREMAACAPQPQSVAFEPVTTGHFDADTHTYSDAESRTALRAPAPVLPTASPPLPAAASFQRLIEQNRNSAAAAEPARAVAGAAGSKRQRSPLIAPAPVLPTASPPLPAAAASAAASVSYQSASRLPPIALVAPVVESHERGASFRATAISGGDLLSPSTSSLAPAEAAHPPRAASAAADDSLEGGVVASAPAAASLAPAEAAALNVLVSVFAAAGMVPSKDYPALAMKLISKGVAHRRGLNRKIQLEPQFLPSIGMKAGQQSRLLRHLSQQAVAAGGAAALPEHADAAALVALKSLFEAAGIVPVADYDGLARQLMEQGVADECSLRYCVTSTPPAFDLHSVIMNTLHAEDIMEYLAQP